MCPLETVEHELLPFLITRQLYTGAGRVTDQGFEITQRADYLDEAVSSATTRSRLMVNTRDEPHSDPDEFRRLHVIGDSTPFAMGDMDETRRDASDYLRHRGGSPGSVRTWFRVVRIG